MAHDLGHPPFGHVGESKLNELVTNSGDDDEGYEGNAQSFRVLTKLALRSAACPGLDLCRAVLNASIKYPWSRKEAEAKASRKFGYFSSETKDFLFAREGSQNGEASVEAQIMDYADDIAYSVHDLEDFHRIRAVPWHILRLQTQPEVVSQMEEMIARALDDWYAPPSDAEEKLEAAAREIERQLKIFPEIFIEPYEGTKGQRVSLRNWTSNSIRRYVWDLKPTVNQTDSGHRLQLHAKAEAEIQLLKQITRRFVIDGPTIGAQQRGQRLIVEEVFADLLDDISRAVHDGRKLKILPKRFHYLVRENDDQVKPARLVADCIASLTEAELVALHRRLRGLSGGSIADPIVR